MEADPTVPTIEFNGKVFACPFHDLMPPLTADDLAELTDDIRARGGLVPVVVTDQDEVLDGQHRLGIAAKLLLPLVPLDVKPGLTYDQKRELAVNLNLHRRHLSREQKRELIARRLKENPDWSNNRVASLLNVDDKTVKKVRLALESTSDIPKTDRVAGKDGSIRPSRRGTAKPGRATSTSTPEPESTVEIVHAHVQYSQNPPGTIQVPAEVMVGRDQRDAVKATLADVRKAIARLTKQNGRTKSRSERDDKDTAGGSRKAVKRQWTEVWVEKEQHLDVLTRVVAILKACRTA
jgi:site-specific DNA-methyltransferase (adenine-specific)